MYRISNKSVAQWSGPSTAKIPKSVDTICPFCGRPMTFALNGWQSISTVNALCISARCSGCRKSANFLWNHGKEKDSSESAARGLYMWPVPKLIREPVAELGITSAFPESLARAYTSAIRTFNMREWVGAAVLCGRLLEGLLRHLLPDDGKERTLAQGLDLLPKHVKLDDPLLKLADGIRKGRNIGAHFDPEKEPDQETTEMMLDLLDYLIEYLFVLPDRVNRLHDRLASAK